MNIEKYSSYFHDGSIDDVNISGNEIIITMSSAQLEDFENEDDISLGRFHEIRGRLHLLNPKKLLINGVISSFEDIKFTKGTILDLDFFPKRIVFNINWRFKGQSDVFEGIEFESVHYYFENLPHLRLANDSDFDDEGRSIGPLQT